MHPRASIARDARHAHPHRCRILVLTLLFIVGCKDDIQRPPAVVYRPQTTPENVIGNLETAYEMRDETAYADLLADDFHFHFDPQTSQARALEGFSTDIGRLKDIAITRKMFESYSVRSISVPFKSGRLHPVNELGRERWMSFDAFGTSVTVDTSPVTGETGRTLFRASSQNQLFFFRKGKTQLDTDAASETAQNYYLVEWRDYGNPNMLPVKEPKILIHLQPVSENPCTLAPPPCSGIRTAGEMHPTLYHAFVLVTDADADSGLSGALFGISYNAEPHAGVDIMSWNFCSTLQFPMPNWPASGTGTLLSWDPEQACQRTEPGGAGTGVTSVAGYFYMATYSPDCLRITPRPSDGRAAIADCSTRETIVETATFHPSPPRLGFACFSANASTPGYNPCGVVTPVEDITWSRIKLLGE